MLRRKPSKIKLQIEDLTEYLEHHKEQPKKISESGDGQYGLDKSFPAMLGGGSRSTPEMRTRQKEIRRKIGFEPLPITPEITNQFDNVRE